MYLYILQYDMNIPRLQPLIPSHVFCVSLSVIVALVSAARQYGLDSAWAVERANQLGYPFDKEPGQPVVKLFRELLRPSN